MVNYGTISQQAILITLIVVGSFIAMFTVIMAVSFYEELENEISTTKGEPTLVGIILCFIFFFTAAILYKKWKLNWNLSDPQYHAGN